MLLFFRTEKVKAHTPTFIWLVKLCKKLTFFNYLLKKKRRDNVNSVPLVRKLVIKKQPNNTPQDWHILYRVWSPLTLCWVLLGDTKHRREKEKKSSRTNADFSKERKKEKTKKHQVSVLFSPTPQTAAKWAATPNRRREEGNKRRVRCRGGKEKN